MNVKKVFLGAALVSVLSVTGCAEASSVFTQSTPSATSTISDAKASIAAEASKSPAPIPSSSGGATRTTVVWSDYDAGTQAEIDLFTKNKDCRGLQSYVGMATATETSVKAKTGHGNDALLKYINEGLASAGC